MQKGKELNDFLRYECDEDEEVDDSLTAQKSGCTSQEVGDSLRKFSVQKSGCTRDNCLRSEVQFPSINNETLQLRR